jgi:hypothetical protein
VPGAEGVEGQSSSSLVASHLWYLGGWVVERLQGALHLGVQKTLGLTSTHYILDLGLLRDGYVLPEGVE